MGTEEGFEETGVGGFHGSGDHDDHAGFQFFCRFGVVEVGVEDLHVAAFVAVVFNGNGGEGFAVLDGVGACAGGDGFLRHVTGFGICGGLGGEFDGFELCVFLDEIIDLVAQVRGFDLGEGEALTEFCDESVVTFLGDVVSALFCERAFGGEVQ